MKVLLIGLGAPGGVGRYERLLGSALATLQARGDLQVTEVLRHAHPSYLGGSHDHRGGSAPRFVSRVFAELTRSRPDAVVFTHPNLARLALPGSLLRSGPATVVCAHGVEVWEPTDRARREALRRARRVVATARWNAERLIAVQGVAPERIRTIPLVLEDEWQARAARSAAPPNERVRLLTVTRLAYEDRYKGVDVAIRAVRAAVDAGRDVEYAIVGDGDDRGRLEQIAADLNVTDRVRFLGRVDDDGLLAEYGRCDVFVLPSKGEGFGFVFLEAMAHGKPVVASPVGGTLDVVDHGVTGLLVDDDALPPALIELIDDEDRRRALGAAGRARVRDVFGREQYVERWAAVLGELRAR